MSLGATTLNAATILSTGSGAINLTTVNGAQTLDINSTGAVTTTGALGGSAALTSLTTNAGGTTVLGGNVTTTGIQTYNDAVTLSGILTNQSGNMTFASTLNVSNTSVLTSDNYAFNGGAASISGAGRLTLLPYTSLANVTIGDTGTNKIPVAPFNNYSGLLAIGGNLADNSVHIGTLNIDAGLNTAGEILLVARNNINLQAGTMTASDRVTMVSQTGNIVTTGGTVRGDTSILAALNAVGSVGARIDVQSTGQSYIEVYTGNSTYYVVDAGQAIKSDQISFTASHASKFLTLGDMNFSATNYVAPVVLGSLYSESASDFNWCRVEVGGGAVDTFLSNGTFCSAGSAGQLNIFDIAKQNDQTSRTADAAASQEVTSSEKDKASQN